MTLDTGTRRLGPNPQFRIGRLREFLCQRLRHIRYRLRPLPQIHKSQRPISRAGWNRLQHRGQSIHGIAQLFAGYGVRSFFVRNCGQRFPQQLDGVTHSREQARFHANTFGQVAATAPHHQQMPRQVSTVHARDVLRFERLQTNGVVPIVKMAAVQFHLPERLKRGFQPLYRFFGADPTEIACAQIR